MVRVMVEAYESQEITRHGIDGCTPVRANNMGGIPCMVDDALGRRNRVLNSGSRNAEERSDRRLVSRAEVRVWVNIRASAFPVTLRDSIRARCEDEAPEMTMGGSR